MPRFGAHCEANAAFEYRAHPDDAVRGFWVRVAVGDGLDVVDGRGIAVGLGVGEVDGDGCEPERESASRRSAQRMRAIVSVMRTTRKRGVPRGPCVGHAGCRQILSGNLES